MAGPSQSLGSELGGQNTQSNYVQKWIHVKPLWYIRNFNVLKCSLVFPFAVSIVSQFCSNTSSVLNIDKRESPFSHHDHTTSPTILSLSNAIAYKMAVA